MKTFLDEDFLLETETSKTLFHNYAEKLPLFDYHCHLPIREISENKPFYSLGELWLAHDHYKWRMMRSCGISEELITGDASWHDKFIAFATALPYAIGNPIYHWAHLELKRYFQINEPLNSKTAEAIWKRTSELLASGMYTPQYFIEKSNVAVLCTTDDPVDSLEYHKNLAKKNWKVKIYPAWRPDKALKIQEPEFCAYIQKLASVSNVEICSFESLLHALENRMDAFDSVGCFASDHDMPTVFCRRGDPSTINSIFTRALEGKLISEEEAEIYKTALLYHMSESYCRRKWAMELHIGCNRNVNEEGVKTIGRSSGFDSPGDYNIAAPLGKLLSLLNDNRSLPKTLLFCMNPKDNWTIASLATTFQGEGIPSKIQFGTAWWMQDHIPGMLAQMEALATTGVLSHFVGMLTDSRSYLSYTRFEYFRRILCNYIGNLVESGQYPNDTCFLGNIISGISFYNARRYFLESRTI